MPWCIGDTVWRRGEEYALIKIDDKTNPPSAIVQTKSGEKREVNIEFQDLNRATYLRWRIGDGAMVGGQLVRVVKGHSGENEPELSVRYLQTGKEETASARSLKEIPAVAWRGLLGLDSRAATANRTTAKGPTNTAADKSSTTKTAADAKVSTSVPVARNAGPGNAKRPGVQTSGNVGVDGAAGHRGIHA